MNVSKLLLLNLFQRTHSNRRVKMFEMIKNPDLLELIFRYLDPASVRAASQVSR